RCTLYRLATAPGGRFTSHWPDGSRWPVRILLMAVLEIFRISCPRPTASNAVIAFRIMLFRRPQRLDTDAARRQLLHAHPVANYTLQLGRLSLRQLLRCASDLLNRYRHINKAHKHPISMAGPKAIRVVFLAPRNNTRYMA